MPSDDLTTRLKAFTPEQRAALIELFMEVYGRGGRRPLVAQRTSHKAERMLMVVGLIIGAPLGRPELAMLRASRYHHLEAAEAIARLVALRELLALDADLEKQVVDLGGAELAAFFEVLDQQPEQLAGADGGDLAGTLSTLAEQRVEHPLAGRHALAAIGVLTQKVVPFHGRSPEGGVVG